MECYDYLNISNGIKQITTAGEGDRTNYHFRGDLDVASLFSYTLSKILLKHHTLQLGVMVSIFICERANIYIKICEAAVERLLHIKRKKTIPIGFLAQSNHYQECCSWLL